MQVVINIPKKVKQTFDNAKDEDLYGNYYDYNSLIGKAIQNGIPLPKGHGRLIDADELYGDFIDGTEGYDCQTWNRSEIGDIIEYAPTIIEADRSEEDG